MKIEIKLKDPESCEGCPLLADQKIWEKHENGQGRHVYFVYCSRKPRYGKAIRVTANPRPIECIEENEL